MCAITDITGLVDLDLQMANQRRFIITQYYDKSNLAHYVRISELRSIHRYIGRRAGVIYCNDDIEDPSSWPVFQLFWGDYTKAFYGVIDNTIYGVIPLG